MSVDHSSFRDLARRLVDGSEEIDWRMCAARAYYSAYHFANSAVHLCPSNDHLSMGAHERIYGRYMLVNTTSAKSIAYVLSTMKRIRNLADYNLQDDFSRQMAVDQLATLDKFIDKVNSFKNVSQQQSV